jgi:hypothetical protein
MGNVCQLVSAIPGPVPESSERAPDHRFIRSDRPETQAWNSSSCSCRYNWTTRDDRPSLLVAGPVGRAGSSGSGCPGAPFGIAFTSIALRIAGLRADLRRDTINTLPPRLSSRIRPRTIPLKRGLCHGQPIQGIP